MDGISTTISTTGVAGTLASNQVTRTEQQRKLRETRQAQLRGEATSDPEAPDAPLENSSEIVDIDSKLPDRLDASGAPLMPQAKVEHAVEKQSDDDEDDDTPKRPRLNVTA